MKRHSLLAWLSAGAMVATGAWMGCSPGDAKDDLPKPNLDGGTDSTIDSNTDGPTLDDVTPDGPGDGGCASGNYVAKQAPASLLFVLDSSESMNDGSKWSSAALAIVSAIDQPTFDTMSVGLLATPNGTVTGPSCVLGFPVGCGNPGLPQVAIKPAGTDKSTAATGVRSEIYKWLSSNSPKAGYDGTPLYSGIQSAIGAIRLSAASAKRILVVITDGYASCTSLSKPVRASYTDINGCPDWEDPANLIKLVKDAHDDKAAPVLSFFVGVPGSDADGSDTNTMAPYHSMRALTAYALAGAPEAVDPGCDGAWAKTSGDPTKPCHFDMSKTGSFDAKALGAAIAKIRGAALGCIYDLPVPADGSTVDKSKVNVQITNGTTVTDLKKRSDATDTCATDGCWDYTTDGKIELIGKACTDAKVITDGKVSIVVGCKTIVK